MMLKLPDLQPVDELNRDRSAWYWHEAHNLSELKGCNKRGADVLPQRKWQ